MHPANSVLNTIFHRFKPRF